MKFRVWDKLKKKYLPNNVYAIINRTDFNAFGIMLSDWEEYKEGEFFYDNFQILEQFTGLLDKNNKEIFEGDVISYNFLTKFSNEKFESKVFFDEYMWLTDEHSLNRLNNIEIVGNIHDNELEDEKRDRSAFGYGIPGDEKAGWLPESVEGLTKREYFAGQVIQGFLAGFYANPNIDTTHISNKQDEIVPQISTILDWTDELLRQLEDEK